MDDTNKLSEERAMHIAHCGVGEYKHACKYGHDNCPAFPPVALPAVVDAEAVAKVVSLAFGDGNARNGHYLALDTLTDKTIPIGSLVYLHPAPASASEPADHRCSNDVSVCKRAACEKGCQYAHLASASVAGASEEITDDMVRAFHDATTDGALGAEASADIRAGLRAALQAMADNERELGLGYETGASEELPHVPPHPEPHIMRWSMLEEEAIRRHGEACAAAALRFALSKPAGQGDGEARDGWVMVPRVPTRDMISAGIVNTKYVSCTVDQVYAAMIAAAPQTLVHADTQRLDWLESDGCTHVFKIGNRWYTRAAHQMPHRRAATLRQAIDAARKPSTDAEGGANG